MQSRKVVIIGSGVAGMCASIYLKRAGIDTLIIESDTPGGQLNRIASIYNYPGFKMVDGPSLASYIYEQVNDLKVDYLFDKVIEIIDKKDKKIVKTTKEEIECMYVIIATGRTARTLNLNNEREYIGRGISFCALCDGALYKNKDVIIVGRTNLAVEEAIYLANICKSVTIINNKDKLEIEEILLDKLKEFNNINIIHNTNIIKYNTDNDKVISVTLNNKKEINTDCVFLSMGYVPINNLIDLKLDNNYIVVDNNYETSIKNIYACGDVIKKNTYQITTAVGEATNVASNIIRECKKY